MLNLKKLLYRILTHTEKWTPKQATVTINVSTGTITRSVARVVGNVMFLTLYITNNASTTAGGNILSGTIVEPKYRPNESAAGVGYYASHSCIGVITKAGALTLRNASSTAVTVTAEMVVNFVYVLA